MREALSRHMSDRFEWGVSDCGALFGDVVEAITGFDPMAEIRGYTNEHGAFKRVRAAGWRTMVELIEATFPEIPPSMAQRGDLVYPANVPHPLMCPAVLDGASAFSKHPAGLVVFPRHLIARAFAV